MGREGGCNGHFRGSWRWCRGVLRTYVAFGCLAENKECSARRQRQRRAKFCVAQSMPDEAQSSLLATAGLERLSSQLAQIDIVAESSARKRTDFLSLLKEQGLTALADRQAVANAVGKHLRAAAAPAAVAPATIIGASDSRLFLSPLNWVRTNQYAITQSPGAYLKLAWTGGDAVELELDSRTMESKFMTLSCHMDGLPEQSVLVPPGQVSARLPLTHGAASSQDAPQKEHTLLVRIRNSVQQLDRWGQGGGAAPASSLKLRCIHLPPGAVAVMPIVRPRRLLAFGCSITEGVCAGYRPDTGLRGGDLNVNDAAAAWVVAAAAKLDAEFGSVGFGRQGWCVAGNGGVPCFHMVGDEKASSSWRWMWRDQPRVFSKEPPEIVIVLHGTNDGLTGADGKMVGASVCEWLLEARKELGGECHLCICIPFGGFGGSGNQPVGALSDGFAQYQRVASSDKRAHLIDLGESATFNLSKFNIVNGRYAPTRESCDGIHPTAERHRELGEALAERVEGILRNFHYLD